MDLNSNALQQCKAVIEEKLGWGPSEGWQTGDFENLSEQILDVTGVSLSISTLRRIWGRTEYNHLPSATTLNTLARFAGSTDWRSLVRECETVHSAEQVRPQPAEAAARSTEFPSKSDRWKRFAWIAGVLIAVGVASTLAIRQGVPLLKKSDYSFESRSVTRGIPNSVIFTYDASASPTDSVFIQQSWDKTKRTQVDKNLHKHTSVYYEPGTYQARLLVGDQVVQEHKLVVGTDGWAGLIEQAKMPVYLKREAFLHADHIGIGTTEIERNNITLQPEPPLVKYFNVGNFETVPLDGFAFSTEIKHIYQEGAAACQLTYISLLTDDMPIVIPLSAKGCVSDLNLMSVDDYLSGKKADLSALGVDFAEWARVSCEASGGKIRYAINGQQAFEFPLPTRPIRIVGVAFGFRGTGSIRHVRLRAGGRTVFAAF